MTREHRLSLIAVAAFAVLLAFLYLFAQTEMP